MYVSIDDHWFAKDFRIYNIRTKRFLEHLEALTYPTVVEVSVFSVTLQNIIGVR